MTTPQQAYEKWATLTNQSAYASLHPYFFNLAGITLCIKLHTPELERPFLSAISHLSIPPCIPDYTVDVWDCRNGAITFPEFDYCIDDVKLRGEIPQYCGNGVSFAYFAHARMVHILNENTKHGIVALTKSECLPKFELACPFRGIFSWILRNNQMAMVHAAALADEHNNGYLIVGQSGAGKSTTAISCLFSGLSYIGDDLCALGTDGKNVQIHSIYCSGKTYRNEWSFIPQLAKLAEPYHDDDFEKEIYFFNKSSVKVHRSAQLKTIYIPTKGSALTTIPPLATLIGTTVDSTRELLPDAQFESLRLLYAAFKHADIKLLPLTQDRRCPINLS